MLYKLHFQEHFRLGERVNRSWRKTAGNTHSDTHHVVLHPKKLSTRAPRLSSTWHSSSTSVPWQLTTGSDFQKHCPLAGQDLDVVLRQREPWIRYHSCAADSLTLGDGAVQVVLPPFSFCIAGGGQQAETVGGGLSRLTRVGRLHTAWHCLRFQTRRGCNSIAVCDRGEQRTKCLSYFFVCKQQGF